MTEEKKDVQEQVTEAKSTGDSVTVSNKEQKVEQDEAKRVHELRNSLKIKGVLYTTASRNFGKILIEDSNQEGKGLATGVRDTSKPQTTLTEQDVKNRAQTLQQALYSGLSGDSMKAIQAIATLSPEELKAVKASYDQQFGKGQAGTLLNDVSARLSKPNAEAIATILAAAEQPARPTRVEQTEQPAQPPRDQSAEVTAEDKANQIRQMRRGLKDKGVLYTTGTRTFGKLEIDDPGEQQEKSFKTAAVDRPVEQAQPTNRSEIVQAQQGNQPEAAQGTRSAEAQAERATVQSLRPEQRDDKSLEADAAAIRKATGNDNLIDRRADREAINQLLRNKTPEQVAAIDQIYQQRYGISLEKEMRAFLTGPDLEKFLNVFQKKESIESQNAGRIRQDLIELRTGSGRSGPILEKDIRDTLGSMTQEQLDKVRRDFAEQALARMTPEERNLYKHGETLAQGKDVPGLSREEKTKAFEIYSNNFRLMSLDKAIQEDPKLSQGTKDTVKILLETGVDKRTDEDTSRLVDIALRSKNTSMFLEAMNGASPDARKAFLENSGEKRLQQTFSGADLRQALDYAKSGKLEGATQVAENTTNFLFQNAQGIELAIKRLTPEERQMYRDGKLLAQGKEVSGLPENKQNEARQFYEKLHEALKSASNKTDLVKWEAVLGDGENSLVSALAVHRGKVYNSSAADIYKSIEGMSRAQYEDAVKHPERREQMKEILQSLNLSSKDVERMLTSYDEKVSAKSPTGEPSYEESKKVGLRPLAERIDAESGTIRADSAAILELISRMTPEEQERYRTNETFRTDVNGVVTRALVGMEETAALDALKKIEKGQQPIEDVLFKLKRLSRDASGPSRSTDDLETAIRDLEKAFKDDPQLRERIVNPKNPEEKRYATEFMQTAKLALPHQHYDQFVKPLLDHGQIPLENKLRIYKKPISNDIEKITAEVARATPEEKDRLKQDPEAAKKLIAGLSESEKAIVKVVLEQGDLRPEDRIRQGLIGSGSAANLVNELKALKPDDLAQVQREYTRKYGSSMDGDLLGKLSGKERVEAQRVLNSVLSLQERANLARDEAQRNRFGGASAFVAETIYGTATGIQSDDAQNQLVRAVAEQNRFQQALQDNPVLQSLPEEARKALQEQLAEATARAVEAQQQATDNVADSRSSITDSASNIGIAAVVLATTIVQPQIGIPLALKLGLAGAALKVGASAALEGVDHSGDYSRLARDAGTGFASAVAATLGPTQLINAFKIGGAAAKEAVSSSLTQIAGQGAKTALKEGGAEALERGLKEATQKVLESGASSVDKEVFQALAERAVAVAIQGKSREALVGQLAQALEGNFQKGLANAVVRFAERQAFNTGSAAAGGAAEGIVEAGFEWKPNLTFEENLSAVATKVAQNTEASALGAAVGSGVAGAAVGRARIVATKPVEAARKAAEETAKQKRQGLQKEDEQKEQEKKKS